MERSLKPLAFLRHLREILTLNASGQDRMDIIMRLISEYMVTDVCSLYICRSDNSLELYATHGLNKDAVHRTTLRIGEGVIGHIAAKKDPIRLTNAPAHEIFSYKPETNEDIFKAMAGVPILRDGEIIGVLAVQNIMQRDYSDDEIDLLETVSVFLSEMLLGEVDVEVQKELIPNLRLEGVSIYEGLVSGNVFLHRPYVKVKRFLADDTTHEHNRLKDAMHALKSSVDSLIEGAASGLVNNDTRNIMETYRMFTRDKGWFRKISAAIEQGLTAEAAVDRIRSETKAHLTTQSNPYMQQRYHDFEDLANRLLRLLSGKPLHNKEDLPAKTILIAQSMGPADLLEYDLSKIRGIIIEEASQTAHVSILARSLSIPMVGRTKEILKYAENYQPILMDADPGVVRLNPDPDIIESFKQHKETRMMLDSERSDMRDRPAISQDNISVSLMMNAGLTYDLPHLEASGAEGIGLFRTELQLLMASNNISFDEQVSFYKTVFDKVGDKSICFRTPDIGGDKVTVDMALSQRHEHNPAMGFRALRISMERPALLRIQIRALIVAAEGRPLNIMFPMISDVFEFQAAKEAGIKEIERMKRLGQIVPSEIRFGLMLEVPAMAFRIRQLSGICDFISVGSNDLLQFYFAADRDNPKTSSRYDRLSPAALSLLKFIVDEANSIDMPISVCGEMAGKPQEAMTLIALGYRNFSIGASQIPQIKMQLQKTNIHALRTVLLPELNSKERTLRKFIRRQLRL